MTVSVKKTERGVAMGSWGVTARESDMGLDFLATVEKNCLRQGDYRYFNVKEILDMLINHITDQIKRANRGASKEEMAFYIDVTFPYRYDSAVTLVAECLIDYFHYGELLIDTYDRVKDELNEVKITEFIFTTDDLNNLLADLRNILDPERDTYKSWEDSKMLEDWQTHMEMLCKSISYQIENSKYIALFQPSQIQEVYWALLYRIMNDVSLDKDRKDGIFHTIEQIERTYPFVTTQLLPSGEIESETGQDIEP